MTKVIFAVICTAIITLTMSASTRMDESGGKNIGSMDSMTTSMYPDSNKNENKEKDDIDVEAIMNECNETYRIEMSYIESLNKSGSFIDEQDMTPKCFMRCLLENTGVLSPDDGMFNPARAAIIFAGERNGKPMEDIADMTALCADRKETCKCERAYNFMRCLMSMEIERYETAQ